MQAILVDHWILFYVVVVNFKLCSLAAELIREENISGILLFL
jgi:hypothetical protein